MKTKNSSVMYIVMFIIGLAVFAATAGFAFFMNNILKIIFSVVLIGANMLLYFIFAFIYGSRLINKTRRVSGAVASGALAAVLFVAESCAANALLTVAKYFNSRITTEGTLAEAVLKSVSPSGGVFVVAVILAVIIVIIFVIAGLVRSKAMNVVGEISDIIKR